MDLNIFCQGREGPFKYYVRDLRGGRGLAKNWRTLTERGRGSTVILRVRLHKSINQSMLWNQSTNQIIMRKSKLCLPIVFNHKNYCHTSNFYMGERKFCIFESYFEFYSGPVIYQSCLEALRRFVLSSEFSVRQLINRHFRSPLMMSLLRPTLMLIQILKNKNATSRHKDRLQKVFCLLCQSSGL